MTIVVSYGCHACGAVQRGTTSAWVRCAHCGVLVAFDFQVWLESAEHAEWLARAAASIDEWGRYANDIAFADAALAKGETQTAYVHFRAAIERVMALTPQVYPPEAQTDPAKREAHIQYAVWWRRTERSDAELAALVAELSSSQARMDLRDPWPTLRATMTLVARQHERAALLGPPPDPDGLELPARVRLAQSLVLSAYLHLLDHAARVVALGWLYGAENVIDSTEPGDAATSAAAGDELGLYFDFACPRCGLVSLTGRSATELTCVGCYHRRPFRDDDLGLTGIAFGCTQCGAPLALDDAELDATCGFCGAAQRRAARTGHVERAFARSVMQATSGHDGSALPTDGVDGFPVRADNREALVLTGLARQATWFAKLVSPARYAGIVRKSLGAMATDDALRARLIAAIATEGGTEDARDLVERALHLL